MERRVERLKLKRCGVEDEIRGEGVTVIKLINRLSSVVMTTSGYSVNRDDESHWLKDRLFLNGFVT